MGLWQESANLSRETCGHICLLHLMEIDAVLCSAVVERSLKVAFPKGIFKLLVDMWRVLLVVGVVIPVPLRCEIHETQEKRWADRHHKEQWSASYLPTPPNHRYEPWLDAAISGSTSVSTRCTARDGSQRPRCRVCEWDGTNGKNSMCLVRHSSIRSTVCVLVKRRGRVLCHTASAHQRSSPTVTHAFTSKALLARLDGGRAWKKQQVQGPQLGVC